MATKPFFSGICAWFAPLRHRLPGTAAPEFHVARPSASARPTAVAQPRGQHRWILKAEVAWAPGSLTAWCCLFLGNYRIDFDDNSEHYNYYKVLLKSAKSL